MKINRTDIAFWTLIAILSIATFYVAARLYEAFA